MLEGETYERIRTFLKRPLSPIRAGLRCALAFTIGILVYRLIDSIIAPLGDTSILLYQVAALALRIAIYALIGLVMGLLLMANRIGPLVAAWVLGAIASFGVRFATARIFGDSLDIFTVPGQLIQGMPANVIFGLFVGLGFRQVRIGDGKPRFPVLKSMLAFVAVSSVQLLNSTITLSRYMRMGAPLSLALFYAISFTAGFVAGGLLGILVAGRPDPAREGVAQ